MASAAHVQSNFSGGEFGKRFQGRVDLDRYQTGLAQCVNWIVPLQGCAYRRPGTQFIALAGDQTSPSVLVRFEFSTTQTYVIEFGHLFIRFYRDGAQITSGGVPVEVASPYDEADLYELQFVQSLDVLYIVHNGYKPRKLTRTSHTSWGLSEISFKDGPYLDAPTSGQTIFPDATTGTVTLTANGPTFVSTDVGRLLRLFIGGVWGYVLITQYISNQLVNAIVQGVTALGGSGIGSATQVFRFGLWSDSTGYPSCITFFQDRLVFAGSTSYPNRLDFSERSEYENFAPSAPNGSITDEHAIARELNSSKVQDIRALQYDAKGLIVLTGTGEWVVTGSSTPVVTPTSLNAVEEGSEGSARLPAIRIGKSTIFLQRVGGKLKEVRFYFDQDGFQPVDLTYVAHHATASGVRQFCYQQEPEPIVWCVRNDGVLAGMTYARNVDSLQVAWHRHILGGVSTDGGAAAKVESACVIPTETGYELWLQVQRYVNGAVVRHIELMKQPFEEEDHQHNAWFVDSALSRAEGSGSILSVSAVLRNSPISVYTSDAHGLANGDEIFLAELEGLSLLTDDDEDLNSKIFTVQGISAAATITIASPGVVTWADHKLVAGDTVKFGTTGALPTGLTAGTTYYVKSPTANTFELSATSGGASINTSGTQSGVHTITATSRLQLYEGGVAVDGALYSSWEQGGRLAKLVSSITGLSHLRGQAVQVLGDGGVQETTVSNDGVGTVALSPSAGFVVAGLGYDSDLETLRVEAAGADGPALGKIQKLEEVSLVVDSTSGIQVGRNEANLGEQLFRDPGDAMGVAPPLVSGIVECENFEGDYSLDNRILIRQSAPLPATILGIMCQVHTEDRT